MNDDLRSQVARLIRQSMEMGEVEWFLDRYGRDEALELLRVRHVPAAPVAPVAPGGMAERGARSASSARPGPSAERSGPPKGTPAPDLPVLPGDHGALREIALGCTRCGLAEGRTQVVFSDGPPDARLMVVGEAPGANEDETGFPFVGAAGKFLDLLLATVDLSREESVYICNVVKCRPPGNRNPEPREIATCSPFLLKQIEVVAPRAILAVGSFAGQLLTGQDKTALGKLRGQVHSYQGVPLVVTYHPAALLRNSNWTRAFWDDLQLLRDVMDGAYLDRADVP
ncbi:MAG: uracil-DNA glycosylase [Gemmatimonadota bacterium]